MKHAYQLFTTIIALCACLSAGAQITLLDTDMGQIGDQIVRYIDSIPTYGPGGAGANQTWDFSGAVNEFTTTTDVMTVASTPYSSTFSSSDYAMQGDGNSYLYLSQSTSDMVTDGAAGDLLNTGELIEAPFSPALTLHEFPRTFESFFSDTYGFIAEADGASFGVYRVRVTHTGTVYDTTDGYGTLITPTGSYNALRVKSTSFTRNVIEAQVSQLFPVWTGVSDKLDTAVSYSWHAKMEKLSIAEYTYDSLGNPGRFVYSTVPPVINVGIASNESSSKTFLYPIPANDRVCISGLASNGVANTAEIYSIEGKMVRQEDISDNCLDTKSLKNGLYLLRIRNSNGVYTERKRFIVQH